MNNFTIDLGYWQLNMYLIINISALEIDERETEYSGFLLNNHMHLKIYRI